MRINSFALLSAAAVAAATLTAARAPAQAPASSTLRDGSHDMDFNIGTWHTDITRFPDPFDDPNNSAKLAGTVTVRPIWNGKAQIEEIEADGPDGHWEGGTLFLYDPQGHQWRQNFVSASVGRFDPPTVGEYRDGNVEYYATDEFRGRTVLIRGVWSDIKPDSHSYEEDLSSDGGRTWHPAFVGHLTRIGR
jgi:hypothetical protein